LGNIAWGEKDELKSVMLDGMIQWLNEPRSKPPTTYLASCALSLPLIGLVQLAHYITLGEAQGLTPNEISSQLKGGVAGHSQGVVVAALIAGELPGPQNTWAEFHSRALHAITVLFHIGFHASLRFPQTSLPPKLISITAEHEGLPTPMLAVTGLALDQLEKAIQNIQPYFAPNDANVSLFNGPRAFVVSGHPRTLVGLVSALRTSKAAPGLDQSKVSPPFFFKKKNIRYMYKYIRTSSFRSTILLLLLSL
jgi:malonyl CoA-acyl carrier protein transacylase